MSRYAALEAALRDVKADTLKLVDDLSTRERAIALEAIAHIGRAALAFETLSLLEGVKAPSSHTTNQ
jgi:hypothetical protein